MVFKGSKSFKKMGSAFLALVLLAVLIGTALASGAETGSESAQTREAQAARDPEKVLASVEKQEIKEKDIDQILQMMGPQGAMVYDNPQGRKAILDELIAMRLFALKGEKDGLDKTPELLASVESFKIQAVARAAIEKALETVTVSDEEAQKYYDEHPDQFTEPEKFQLSHILVSDDVTSADTLKKIEADLASGASFDAVAKELSLCPSASQGGDLGFVGKGQMVPEFETAAFALKEPGEISKPVKTSYGWHIIKLVEKKPASKHEFEKVKSQILQGLDNEKKGQAYQAALAELKKTFTVTMAEPAEAAPAQETPTSEDKK